MKYESTLYQETLPSGRDLYAATAEVIALRDAVIDRWVIESQLLAPDDAESLLTSGDDVGATAVVSESHTPDAAVESDSDEQSGDKVYRFDSVDNVVDALEALGIWDDEISLEVGAEARTADQITGAFGKIVIDDDRLSDQITPFELADDSIGAGSFRLLSHVGGDGINRPRHLLRVTYQAQGDDILTKVDLLQSGTPDQKGVNNLTLADLFPADHEFLTAALQTTVASEAIRRLQSDVSQSLRTFA